MYIRIKLIACKLPSEDIVTFVTIVTFIISLYVLLDNCLQTFLTELIRKFTVQSMVIYIEYMGICFDS